MLHEVSKFEGGLTKYTVYVSRSLENYYKYLNVPGCVLPVTDLMLPHNGMLTDHRTTRAVRIRTKAIPVRVMPLVWLGGSADSYQHVNHYIFEVLSVTNLKHTAYGLRHTHALITSAQNEAKQSKH